jgi:lipopolysaccharide export system permease protein
LLLFSLGLGSLLCLILIGRVLQLRELLLGLSLGVGDLALLFIYLSPFFLVLLIPVACMLSVFLTFLRLSTERELVALKACGLSLYQLTPAPAVFCLLCAGATLIVSLYGLSWGMENFREAILEHARTRTQLALRPGVFNREFPGLTLYARQVESGQGVMRDILVQDSTRENISALILAPRGRVVTDPERGRIYFMLKDGRIYRQEDERVGMLSFDTYLVRLDLNRLLSGHEVAELKPKEMSWSKLQQAADDPSLRERDNGNYYRKILVEKQKRWALPMACIVLGLFALPLACAFEGMRRQYGLILALGLFLGYYTLFSLGLTTGEAGTLPPAAGLWLPNAAFLIFGLLGLRMAAREQSLRIFDWLRHLDFRRWRRT